MDQEKMAEGRRLAAEKRQTEAEQRRVEEEKQHQEEERRELQRLEEEEKRCLEPATIREFQQLEVKLKTFYDQFSILSKKTPDGPLNKFKLGLLNDTLKKTNAILGATHRPFPDFEVFAVDELPSTSDAVLMLSHYRKSMNQFHTDHSERDSIGGRNWCAKGVQDDEDED